MSEQAETQDFTARAALETIYEATSYEDPLRQRTEGVTWMVYGMATAAIFITYALFDQLWTGTFPWWGMFLWAPWIVAAGFTTAALWRSAALSEPDIVKEEPSWRAVTFLWVAFFVVAWSVSLTYDLHGAVLFMVLVGSAWFLASALNLYKCSRRGVRVGATIGGVTAVLGLALAGGDALGVAGESAVGLAAAALSGLVPLLGGYWQTRRG